MFLAGLNEELTTALAVLGKHIPSIMEQTQIYLIQLIAYIITRKPYTINRITVSDSREKPKDVTIEPNHKVTIPSPFPFPSPAFPLPTPFSLPFSPASLPSPFPLPSPCLSLLFPSSSPSPSLFPFLPFISLFNPNE